MESSSFPSHTRNCRATAKNVKNSSFEGQNFRSRVSDFKYIYERTYFNKKIISMESQKELKKAFFSNPEFSLQVAQNASRIVWGKKRETATSFLSK